MPSGRRPGFDPQIARHRGEEPACWFMHAARIALSRPDHERPLLRRALAQRLLRRRVGGAADDDRRRSVSALAGSSEGLAAAHLLRAHGRLAPLRFDRASDAALMAHAAPPRVRKAEPPDLRAARERSQHLPSGRRPRAQQGRDAGRKPRRAANPRRQRDRGISRLRRLLRPAHRRHRRRARPCASVVLHCRQRRCDVARHRSPRACGRARRLDLRNHRKIAVIDGRIAYTGSQNLVDSTFKAGLTYEELNVRLAGPIALELQAVFAEDWYVDTGEHLGEDRYVPNPEVRGDVAVQTLPSGPGYPRENNQRLIVSLIHAANLRVFITMPYFVPDDAILQAIQTAALGGVEVTLVVPLQINQVLVGYGQRSYY